MPSSHPQLLHSVIGAMTKANPRTILDVGCGNGKFGFLAREYLGLWKTENGSTHRFESIDAIEVWEPYIGDLQRLIYDRIVIGNICDICDDIDSYEMILMIEVLEHLEKDDGVRVIEALKKKSDYLVVTTPMKVENQGAEHGNEFEIHRSQWTKEDFKELHCTEYFFSEEVNHHVVYWF